MSDLWVEPPSAHFKHDQEEQLKKALEDLDKHLILSPINLPQDVVLDAEARIGTGAVKYKLTHWSLFQLCKLVCPCMYGFVSDLSGAHRTKDLSRDDCSFDDSVEILNRVIKRRFRSKILNKIALLNVQQQTVDGFVSASYRWLANHELYARTKAAMQEMNTPVTFLEGELNGRWLLLRYINTKPFVTVKNKDGIEDRFFTGYHFSNNEVGKAAVRAATVLYRKFSKSADISPVTIKDSQVRHIGFKFGVKLDQLIKNMMLKQHDPVLCVANIQTMESTPLGLGNRSARIENHRAEDIVVKLISRKIPASIARHVVDNLRTQGSYDEVPIEPTIFRPVERTVFDLYNALGRCAVSLPINQRERAEQAAHAISTGKIVFN